MRREDFWTKLIVIRGLSNDPRCFKGDFNVVRFLRERRKCLKCLTVIRVFPKVIEELHFKDLPLESGLLTWSGEYNQSSPRLGCFLISKNWKITSAV